MLLFDRSVCLLGGVVVKLLVLLELAALVCIVLVNFAADVCFVGEPVLFVLFNNLVGLVR